MERDGLGEHQVSNVSGLADRQLRFPDVPFDARKPGASRSSVKTPQFWLPTKKLS
jgi:hypothetical protein